jgi:biopolymer transport protein ExbD
MAGGLDHAGDELVENSEINVTPFIDVMLVLLIIFMVAAPLSTVDAPVDLPVSTARAQPRPDKPVIVTMKADSSLLVGETPTTLAALGSAVDMATRIKRDQRIYLRADQAVSYGELTRLMNALRVAGYLQVALVGLEGNAGPAAPPAVSGGANP